MLARELRSDESIGLISKGVNKMNAAAKRISFIHPGFLKVLILALVLALITGLSVGTARAAASVVTRNVDMDINLATFVPCAAGGEGEVVFLSGTEHAVFVTVVDSSGTFHTQAHFQPQGISGEGLTTGDSYQWTGATQASFNGQVGYENTFINNYRIIGPGPGINLMIQQTFHATIQADGTVSAYVDDYTVTCN